MSNHLTSYNGLMNESEFEECFDPHFPNSLTNKFYLMLKNYLVEGMTHAKNLEDIKRHNFPDSPTRVDSVRNAVNRYVRKHEGKLESFKQYKSIESDTDILVKNELLITKLSKIATKDRLIGNLEILESPSLELWWKKYSSDNWYEKHDDKHLRSVYKKIRNNEIVVYRILINIHPVLVDLEKFDQLRKKSVLKGMAHADHAFLEALSDLIFASCCQGNTSVEPGRRINNKGMYPDGFVAMFNTFVEAGHLEAIKLYDYLEDKNFSSLLHIPYPFRRDFEIKNFLENFLLEKISAQQLINTDIVPKKLISYLFIKNFE